MANVRLKYQSAVVVSINMIMDLITSKDVLRNQHEVTRDGQMQDTFPEMPRVHSNLNHVPARDIEVTCGRENHLVGDKESHLLADSMK